MPTSIVYVLLLCMTMLVGAAVASEIDHTGLFELCSFGMLFLLGALIALVARVD